VRRPPAADSARTSRVGEKEEGPVEEGALFYRDHSMEYSGRCHISICFYSCGDGGWIRRPGLTRLDPSPISEPPLDESLRRDSSAG
jgi:hypothetical protein